MAPRKVLKISGEWATSLDFHVPWPMKGSMEGLVMDLLCLKKTSGGGGLQHLGVIFWGESIHKGSIKTYNMPFLFILSDYYRLLTACSQAAAN